MRLGKPTAISSRLIVSESSGTANLPTNNDHFCNAAHSSRTYSSFLELVNCYFVVAASLHRNRQLSCSIRRILKTSFTSRPPADTQTVSNKNFMGETRMAESRGVAILVGAGDAIGAAVARRFANGGHWGCTCGADGSQSQ